MGGVSKRWCLLKGKSNSPCQTSSSDLKGWLPLLLLVFLCILQTPSRPPQPSLFLSLLCVWRGWRWIPCFMVWIKGHFYWGPINGKGQQGGTRSSIPHYATKSWAWAEAAWHAVCFYSIRWTLSLCYLTFLYCELRHQEVQAGKLQVYSTWRPWGLVWSCGQEGRPPILEEAGFGCSYCCCGKARLPVWASSLPGKSSWASEVTSIHLAYPQVTDLRSSRWGTMAYLFLGPELPCLKSRKRHTIF